MLKQTVRKGPWENLGFASTGASGYPSIAIDSDNNPFVVFIDGDNGNKVHVMKWDSGTDWTDLGFVEGLIQQLPSVAIGSDNKLVVVFSDYDLDVDGKAHVLRYEP